jgi:hypothetical protein
LGSIKTKTVSLPLAQDDRRAGNLLTDSTLGVVVASRQEVPMSRPPYALLALTMFTLVACFDKDEGDDTGAEVDADGDGFSESEDCDDADATQHPGSDEYCNDEDDDCDGTIDEDDALDASIWYQDRDEDGYGDPARTKVSCSAPSGYLADDSDCDDLSVTAHPGADEYCNDEDDDCDGTVDEDDALDVVTWYADTDSDGFGDAANTTAACVQPSGYLSDDTDCDDTDASVHPGTMDTMWVDNNCDGVVDTASLSAADYRFSGVMTGYGAGNSVSSAGDVDGDGLDDILVGSPVLGMWAAGRADLVLGASLGATEEIGLADSGYAFIGVEIDATGFSVSSAGDVDGDGLDDILVGAPMGHTWTGGKAYLVLGASLGADTAFDLADADYTFIGEAARDYAGIFVASAGDVDGDGLDDLLIGAYGNDERGEYAGKAYLVLGASLGADVEINLADADYAFIGEAAGDYAGWPVSSAGDVDGDGLDDIIVGAHYAEYGGSNAGKAYLVLGASLGVDSEIDLVHADYAFIGEAAGDKAGWSVSSAGDVDGDGLDDLLVGAHDNDDGGSYAGKAYLVLGASLGADAEVDLADADYAFIGEAAGDYAGHSVSSAGDVDGDGLDDIIVGAPYNDEGGEYAGKAYLVLGASLGAGAEIDLEHADFAFIGEVAYDQAGYSISNAGDVNGDELDDILVGAPDASTMFDGYDEPYAGKAYLILGGP